MERGDGVRPQRSRASRPNGPPGESTHSPAGLTPRSRKLQLCLAIAVMLIAGLAHLTGTSPLVTASTFALGLIGFVQAVRTVREDARVASQVTEDAVRSREKIETLADRMWELQESEERFRGLIDALGDILVHRDRDGRIVYANRVLANLLGRKPEELSGKTLSELGIDIGLVPDAAFSDGECLSSTDVAIHAKDGQRWFSWIELSVRDEASDAVSHRAIARDITARKRAETQLINARERAEHANQAKSRFLATVSHEIRTPMNGILGMAKMLADTQLSAEQHTYVSAVSTSAGALLALIEDLLDYSKIEADRLELEVQPTSPRELAENVVELLSARAFAKDIGLGCFVAPGVPAMISTDPGRLRQVLLNLLGNAIKFTDCGGILVSVEPAELDDKPAIRMAVADTGPGLSESDRERIFRHFEQVDGSSTRRHGGTGLGLAISKRIVDTMKGRISVESTPGEGSEFAVLLPVEVDAKRQEDEVVSLDGINVLVMTPHRKEAEAIASTIGAHDGHAVIASSVDEATMLGREHKTAFDAVLVDASMETPDGQLLRRIREAHISHREAITLIAPTDRGRLGEFRACGYGMFLARPVRGTTLLRMLKRGREEFAAASDVRSGSGSRARNDDGLSILIAEDNDINAMLARAALTKAGHHVDIVRTGRAAVEAAANKARRYDVVLMDLHMPVMDGLDAIANIRRHEEETGLPPVPIVVLSADGQEATRHGVLAHGASGFLTKPLDPDKLINAVEQQAAA